MTTRKQLLDLISRHIATTGMSATKLCQLAGVDHHVVSRLRSNDSITLQSIERLESVIQAHSNCAEAL